MKVLRRLWADEAGFVISAELALVATILTVGMVAGLVTLRDAVVQELADVAGAIGNVSQSYEYTQVTGYTSAAAGSHFQDELDFCDVNDDVSGSGAQCLIVHTPLPPDGLNEETVIDPGPVL